MGHVNALLGGEVFGGWAPPSLPGLFAWFDPSDGSTLTLSGSTITALSDKSGQGNHLVARGSGGPTLVTWSGRDALSYVSGQGLGTPATNAGAGIDQISYAVVWAAAATGQGSFTTAPCMITAANAGAPIDHWDNGGGNIWFGVHNYPPTSGGWLPIRTRTVPTVGVWQASRAGMTQYLGTTQVGAYAGSPPWQPGGRLCLGIREDGATTWAGYIGEAVVWTGPIADPDRIAVTNYLSTRWGIA